MTFNPIQSPVLWPLKENVSVEYLMECEAKEWFLV